jgi:hypothetical protein
MSPSWVSQRYPIMIGDGRSTEALVAAGDYGYAHSCVTSDNFPVRRPDALVPRDVVLLQFADGVTSPEAVAEATRLGLERPIYEDALAFGAAYPAVQVERSVVFLHDPWFGFFGRRDVISLWCNAGRRELGLEGIEGPWTADWRFGFVRAPARSALPE